VGLLGIHRAGLRRGVHLRGRGSQCRANAGSRELHRRHAAARVARAGRVERRRVRFGEARPQRSNPGPPLARGLQVLEASHCTVPRRMTMTRSVAMPEHLILVSADGHAGPLVADYRPYVDDEFLDEFDRYVPAREAWRAKRNRTMGLAEND